MALFRNFSKALNYPKISFIRPAFRFSSDSVKVDEIHNIESKTEKPPHGGFAKAFLKYTSEPQDIKEDIPFATLLRRSKFINLGEPEGKKVIGTIFHIVGDDLYIDFGGKFHCVCPRPEKNSESYNRGTKVWIRLKELELSTRFLGSDKDLTLLEADASIIGLAAKT